MLDHTIDTTIQVDAHPTRVWDVLTDLRAYPSWNPFLPSVEGRLVVGERLTVRFAAPGRAATTVRPVVIAFSQGRELRWLARGGLPGVLDAAHGFQVLPDGGGTIFRQSIAYVGLFVPFSGLARFRAVEAGFIAMNEALKRRAEAA